MSGPTRRLSAEPGFTPSVVMGGCHPHNGRCSEPHCRSATHRSVTRSVLRLLLIVIVIADRVVCAQGPEAGPIATEPATNGSAKPASVTTRDGRAILRSTVPHSRPESWPVGERVPVPFAEFERWWRQHPSTFNTRIEPVLERAVYTVTTLADGSWGGDFEWTVSAPGEFSSGGSAGWLRVPATDLILESLRTASGTDLEWGVTETGDWLVPTTPGRGLLRGKWTRPSVPSAHPPDYELHEVVLDVPLGVTTRLVWRVPVDWTLEAVTPANVVPGKVEGNTREWWVAVGATPVRIATRPRSGETIREPSRPVYSMDTAVAVRPDSTRCQSDLMVTSASTPLAGLTLRLPAKSSLLSVHLQDTQLETRYPEIERPDLVEVRFPEPLTGEFGPLRVRWISGPSETGSLVAETPGIEGGVFLDGNLAVRVEQPFRVSDFDSIGLRPSSAVTRPDGDAISARQWRSDARLTLRIGEAPFAATVDQAVRVHVGEELATATARTVWTATGGQARTLALQVPGPWMVLDVRPVTTIGAVAAAGSESIAWHPGATDRIVEIELVEPLLPSAPLTLDLLLATPRNEFPAHSGASLTVPVTTPVVGTATAPWVAVSTSEGRPFRVRSNGTDITPAQWPTKYASLAAPPGESAPNPVPVDAFPIESPLARPDIVLEEPREPVELRCVVTVTGDEEGQLVEELEITAKPTGKTVDRFSLRGLDGSSRWNWTVTAPSALRVVVRPMAPTVANESRSPRADEPFAPTDRDANMEWLFELSEPVTGPVVVKGGREGSRRPPCATSLPRAPKARAFEGVLRLDAARSFVPTLTGADWAPVPGVAGSTAERPERVRVDRAYPERVTLATWSTPVVQVFTAPELVCEAEIHALLGVEDQVGHPARHLILIRLHGLPTRPFDLAWKLSEETVRCRCVADGRPIPVVREGVRFSCAIPATASFARQLTVEYEFTDGTGTDYDTNGGLGSTFRWIDTSELPLPLWSPTVSASTLSISLPPGRELVGSPVGPQGYWNEVLAVPESAGNSPKHTSLLDVVRTRWTNAPPEGDTVSASQAFRAGEYVSPGERMAARRFHVLGAPSRVRFSVYSTSLRDVLGWFVGCLSLAVALAIRRFRGPSTRRWRLFVPLMLLPLVAVAPEPLRTVAATGLAAYAVGWILPARWLRPTKRDSRSRRPQDRSGVSSPLAAGAVGLCLLCGIPSGHVRAQSTTPEIGSATPSTTAAPRPFEVLIPVDEAGNLSTDGVAYVPVELLAEIARSRGGGGSPILAGAAEYRVAPKGEGSLSVSVRLEYLSPGVSDTKTGENGFARPAPRLIPLPWTEVRWDASRPALANGRPAPLIREGERVSLLVPRETPGRGSTAPDLSRDIVELAFDVPQTDGRWILPLTPAPHHRIAREEAPPAPVNVPSTGTNAPPSPLRMSIDGAAPRPLESATPVRIGPASRRIEIFPPRSSAPRRSRFTSHAESVIEVRADLTIVRVLLSGRSEGAVHGSWGWAVPAGWEIGDLGSGTANLRVAVLSRAGRSIVEAVRTGTEPLDWSVSFTLRRPRGAADEPLELPPPGWTPVEHSRDPSASIVVETGTPRVLIRALPGFEMEFAENDDTLAVPLPPDARLSARVPSDLPTWGMYQALRDVPWRFVVRESPSTLRIDTDLDLLVDRDRVGVVLSAGVDDHSRSRLVLRPRLPEGLVVTDVDVLEGEVSRLWRWTREGDRLNILLSERPRQRQRVVVRGTIATGSGQGESALPRWTWPGEQEDSGDVTLWTVPGLAPVAVTGGTRSSVSAEQVPETSGPFPGANLLGRWAGADAPASFRRTTHEMGRVAYGMVRALGTTADGALRIEYRLRLFGPPLVADFPSIVFPKVWERLASQGRTGVVVNRLDTTEPGWELRPEAAVSGESSQPAAKLEAVWTAEIPPVEGDGVWRVFPPAVTRVGTLETGWDTHRDPGFTGNVALDQRTSDEFLKAYGDRSADGVAPVPLPVGGIVVSGTVARDQPAGLEQSYPHFWQHLVRIGAEGGLDGETWAFFPGDSLSTYVPLPDGVEVLARVGERGIATKTVDARVRVTNTIPPTLRMEHVRWRVVGTPEDSAASSEPPGHTGSGPTRVSTSETVPAPWSILRRSISFSGIAASRPQPITVAFAPEWSTRLLPAPTESGRWSFRLSQADRLLDLIERGLSLDAGPPLDPVESPTPTSEWSAWRFAIAALLDIPEPVIEEQGPVARTRWTTLKARLAGLEQGPNAGSVDTASRRSPLSKEMLLRGGRGLPIFDGNPGLIASGEGIDYILIEPSGSAVSRTPRGTGETKPPSAASTETTPIALRLVSIARFWNLLFAGTAASLAFLLATRFLPLGRFLAWVQARAWRGALVATVVLWAGGLLGTWGLPIVASVLVFGTVETLIRRRPREVAASR